jgi:hypothetical protein
MSACTPYIIPIEETNCLSDSLELLNANFLSLSAVTCTLKQRIDKLKSVRTFFYYGPFSQISSRSGQDPDKLSRPSDETISLFVNSTEQLNLPSISFEGDIAWVIYQKTGFRSNIGNTLVPNIPTSYQYPGKYTEDVNNQWSPTLFIWKLIYTDIAGSGLFYRIENGFPKIHRAQTGSDFTNWNSPSAWNTYNSWGATV